MVSALVAPAMVRIGNYMNPDQLQRFLVERAEQREYARDALRDERLLARWMKEWGHLGIRPVMGGAVSVAYTVCTATVFAMTTGAKTMLNSIAPAGHGLALTEFGVSFDGVTASAVPAFVEPVTSTQAGAGTSGVTPTITQVRGRTTSGSAPTGGSNYTGEPTTLVRTKPQYISQLMGTYVYQAPLGREIECDSSGGTIKALALRGTVTANVNMTGWMEVEAVG